MNDYKELCEELRSCAEKGYFAPCEMVAAADVIEQLVKERDAAIADINSTVCHSCIHTGGLTCRGADGLAVCCNAFEWRGVQE